MTCSFLYIFLDPNDYGTQKNLKVNIRYGKKFFPLDGIKKTPRTFSHT